MAKKLFTKLVMLLLSLQVHSECYCQSDWDVVKEAKTLPIISNWATVEGFGFDKTLYISKDSLNEGFTVALQDPSYKIVFFRLAYDCENCDIWVKTIYGNSVTIKDAPILKRLKKGEILSFVLFKLEKGGKFFTIPEFNIIVTE